MPYTLVRWRFFDPSTLESHEFMYNPNEGGTPSLQKHFEYSKTAAAAGRTLVFEGRDEPQKITFNGIVLEQTEYDAMIYWFNKRNQIYVIDDLGRQFSIVIEQLTLNRKRSALHQWRHDYTVNATIVDWPT